MFDLKKFLGTKFFILPVVTGLLLVLTLPWVDLSFLVWVALIPLFFFLSQTETNHKQAFQAGMVAGVVYFSAVVYPLFSLKAWWWLDVKEVVYENKFLLLFWILYAAVVIASFLFGLFAIFFKKIHRNRFSSIFALSVAWVFFEYIHAKILFGFTWGDLGYSLHDSPQLSQLARYGGVYSLSFLIIFVNILLFHAIRRTLPGNKGTKNVAVIPLLLKERYFYLAIFTILVAILCGYLILKKQPEYKNLVSVAIIQPGNQNTPHESDARVLNMVSQSLANNPALVVISESAFFPVVIDENDIAPMSESALQKKDSYSTLLRISKKHPSTSFIIGAETQREGDHYNSILVLEKGAITSIYHKRALFPFSERSIPWINLKTIGSLAQGGKGDAITIQGKQVSALICSEVLFSGLVNNRSTNLIVAIGNDGVFGSPRVAEYNNIIARFVAIETQKYLIRAMKTGVSGITTPSGSQIERSRSTGQEFISGKVPI